MTRKDSRGNPIGERAHNPGRPPLADEVCMVVIKTPVALRDAVAALAARENRPASEIWRAAAQAWVTRYE